MISKKKTSNLSILEKPSYLYWRKSGKTKHRCCSVSFIVSYWMNQGVKTNLQAFEWMGMPE
jgi:hypothetical protein